MFIKHQTADMCRWGATPLQDAFLSGDKVMCALLERAGGKKADDPAIRDKLPALQVTLLIFTHKVLICI